jgi:hypothetical protein
VLEWQALMCGMHVLRRAFCGLRGFYLLADVHSVNITWLMPHATSQVRPKDVDMRVMLTFLEFNHSLLRFALHKLYYDLGLRYPPLSCGRKRKKCRRSLQISFRSFLAGRGASRREYQLTKKVRPGSCM